jgi:hypothetical protein
MNAIFGIVLAVAAAAVAPQAAAQITFYERQGFEGRSFTASKRVDDVARFGFNDRASSVVVVGERWEVCEDARFGGRCAVLRPGRYPSLAAMGLNNRISSVRALSAEARIDENRYAPLPAAAQITFYEREGFQGRSLTTNKQVNNFARFGFNDRASSVDVLGERWEVCENAQFKGRCVVLRPGRYPSLASMRLNDRISSVRAVDWNARIDDDRYAPEPVAKRDGRDYRRRSNERVYEANVTSVRAVLGTPEQRCWVEREQVVQERSDADAPGAVAAAIIAGILGYGGQQPQTQDVQRCENVPSQAHPDYWDVTYNFRGQEHRVKMTAPPGRTITVNERGEPRT